MRQQRYKECIQQRTPAGFDLNVVVHGHHQRPVGKKKMKCNYQVAVS